MPVYMNGSKFNIGTDIVEVDTFRHKPLKANMRFYNSIFTKSELARCLKYSDPYPHLAGIFAAKESIIKCLNGRLRMADIEIIQDSFGKPTAVTHYNNKAIKTEVSISHTQSLAIAFAIVVS
jgi:phosphopantetheine--protein transferase-like protein